MRAKLAGAFIIGVAVGALLLALALWRSGSLGTSSVVAGSQPAPCTSSPTTLAEASRGENPPAVASAPAPAPPAHVESKPETHETGPAPGHLAMPIEGIDPNHIPDTFYDNRSGRHHEALDIMAPRGTPVKAVAEGNVVKLFNSKDGGLTVYQFDNSGTYSYYYAHLDRYARGLKEGMLLGKGDVLGYVGSTGNASAEAPHLHFAVNRLGADKKWWEGTPIDPLPLLR